MANFNEFTQSNDFKVKNIKEFKKELIEMGGISFFEFHGNDEVCVASHEGLQSYIEIEDQAEDICNEYDDYLELIQNHMCPYQKVFINSIGYEKLRYFAAECTIVTKDDIVHHDFFNKMGKEFNNGCSVF